MFTGIVQSIGVISALTSRGHAALLEVESDLALDDVQIGESIAVNGCCLTVVDKKDRRFSADLSDETLRFTTFASARIGERVNLERALRFSDRLGGHLVTGHVDTVGEIEDIEKSSGSIKICVAYTPVFSKYLTSKGCVAVDGISLTASLVGAHVAPSAETSSGGASPSRGLWPLTTMFSVHIIPHTGTHTTLVDKRIGDRVNLEWDYLAKITESLLSKGSRI